MASGDDIIRRGDIIRAEPFARLLREAMRSITVRPPLTMTRIGDAVSIGMTPAQRPGRAFFIAKVTASTADGTNRWKYSWSEVRKTTAGYGTWATFTGGLSGTSDLRNTCEDMNSASGVQGNGVDVANLTGTFAIKPIPANCILQIWQEPVGTSFEWWCEYQNGVDGGC